eukprot:scaffold1885_cov267-Chaetoceros_neogracile.AAC.2
MKVVKYLGMTHSITHHRPIMSLSWLRQDSFDIFTVRVRDIPVARPEHFPIEPRSLVRTVMASGMASGMA